MARNRKPPSGRTIVTSDGSPGWEAAGNKETGNKEDIVHVTDQFFTSFPITTCSDSNYASLYQSNFIDSHTPYIAFTPSLYASPSKRLATPPLVLNFNSVLNLLYFRG
jgi:hypothetical protein